MAGGVVDERASREVNLVPIMITFGENPVSRSRATSALSRGFATTQVAAVVRVGKKPDLRSSRASSGRRGTLDRRNVSRGRKQLGDTSLCDGCVQSMSEPAGPIGGKNRHNHPSPQGAQCRRS
jgi:hypothetical protein